MAQKKQSRKVEMTAKQMSHEIQQLIKALGPEEFEKVFEKSLLEWIKALPEGKKKLKLLQDLYPALPQEVQDTLARETGFTFADGAAQA
jgi:hypothetical protein